MEGFMWHLPMNMVAWLLVKLTRADFYDGGEYLDGWVTEYVVPRGGWAHRLFKRSGFAAITPSASCVIYCDVDCAEDVNLQMHELEHVEQHRKYGPFFLPVYIYHAVRSRLRGEGWYRGNALEKEARGERE